MTSDVGIVPELPAISHPELGRHSLPRTGPPPAHPAIPLNLSLAGALARQHQEGHLHLGLIGLQWEVSLAEQLGGGPDTLPLQALLEVLRNLKGSDYR